MDSEEVDTPVVISKEAGGNSLVDLIKADLQEAAKNVDVYISVAGREKSGLAFKYHLPETGKVIDEIGKKVERESKDEFYRALNTTMDTIIHLCEGIYVKPPGVTDYVMLDPQEAGFPVKFDDRMAEIVGLQQGATARSILKKIFGGNDMAIMSHGERLSRWLNNTNADLEKELWQVGN